jgi:hypothetical protein
VARIDVLHVLERREGSRTVELSPRRWRVVEGDQELIVEAIEGGPISVHTSRPGEPFVASPEGIEDLRRKLGAAILVARSPEVRDILRKQDTA